MFTGIIQSVGHVAAHEVRGGDARLVIDAPGLDLGDVAVGDSIAVAGVCLTAIALDGSRFSADVSAETLRLTTLGSRDIGWQFNLEADILSKTVVHYLEQRQLGASPA